MLGTATRDGVMINTVGQRTSTSSSHAKRIHVHYFGSCTYVVSLGDKGGLMSLQPGPH